MRRPAIATTEQMIAEQVDLDIIIGLLSDHYGIDVLVLPENVDRLMLVTLANRALDSYGLGRSVLENPAASDAAKEVRKLARIVLDLMTDHRAPEGT